MAIRKNFMSWYFACADIEWFEMQGYENNKTGNR